MKNINIQWVTQDATLFELDWLNEILSIYGSGTEIHIVRDFKEFKTDKNSLVICNHAVNYRVFLDALRQNSRHYGVFLLSDENLYEQCEWLHDPGCLFCVRNYVHPMYVQHPKVLTVGLGYKRHFQEYLTKTEERRLLWSFAGTPHGERRQMFEVFKDLEPNQTHDCSGFCASDALTTRDYAQTLEQSKFALCPPGQDSMDSFRMYEALEAGCIPVTLSNSRQLHVVPTYWHAIFRDTPKGELPFIVGDSWEECKSKVKEVIKSDKLNIMQTNCTKLWDEQKQMWKTEIQKRSRLLAS